MRRLPKRFALAALLLTACGGGYGYVGFGYYPCDPYYYDDLYCYDYYYATWRPSSLAVTDFDADGRLDAVVSDRMDGAVWFARGHAGGGFDGVPAAPFTLPSAAASVAPVNADGDAKPDLLVLDGSPGRLLTYFGDGFGGFAALSTLTLAAAVTPGVLRFALGTLDGDAIDDVVTVDEVGAVQVALGTGAGAFVDAGHGDPAASFLGPDVTARLAGVFVALADFDAQPGTDLAVLDGARASLAFFSGHGDGAFGAARVVSVRVLGDVLAIAPVTVGIGRPADLAVLSGDPADDGTPSTLAVVRASDGGFGLGPTAVGTARSIVPFDLDGDGLTDLLLPDELGRAIRTLRARGAGRVTGGDR